jgi:hypothetical protein
MKRFNVSDPSKIPIFMKPGSPEAEINAPRSTQHGSRGIDPVQFAARSVQQFQLCPGSTPCIENVDILPGKIYPQSDSS